MTLLNYEYPLVIISIVTWNNSDYIFNCIRAVQASNYSNFQIIVFDNNSHDDTVEIVKAFSSNIRIIKNGINIGFAAAHNYNISLQEADYYLVLNPDAILSNDYISKAVEIMENKPDVGALSGLLVLDNDENIIDC